MAILLVVIIGPPAARSDDDPGKTFLELKPDRVAPGERVAIRAACKDTKGPGDGVAGRDDDSDDGDRRPRDHGADPAATVTSRAFGEVTLTGPDDQLTGAVTVPAGTRPDTYQARLHCPDGSSARAELMVLDPRRPIRGPDTGGGGTADGGGADAGGTGAERTGPTGTALIAGTGLAALLVGSLLLARRRRAS